jgi:hypothetical protein
MYNAGFECAQHSIYDSSNDGLKKIDWRDLWYKL